MISKIINRSESITEIAKALNYFQLNVKRPTKTATNPFINQNIHH